MWIALGTAAVCLGICIPLYMRYRTFRLPLAAAFKSLATLCAMVPALTAALKLNPLCWVLVGAMALYAAADSILEYRFLPGMGCFLLGHICSIAFFVSLFPLSLSHLICLLILMAGFGFLLWKNRKQAGKSIPSFVVYGLVLSLMVSCGIAGGGSAYSLHGLLIALGAALFAFSDGLLFNGLFHPTGKESDWIIMITYELSLLLLGNACLLI